MNVVRRERWLIIANILEAIDHQRKTYGNEARVTNVGLRANISYSRLVTYLEELAWAELITDDPMPRITPKGREFLREYRRWLETLDRFGIGGSV